jgi:hypothetical protein
MVGSGLGLVGWATQAKAEKEERERKILVFFLFLEFPKQFSNEFSVLCSVLNQTTQYRNSNAAASMHNHVARPYN